MKRYGVFGAEKGVTLETGKRASRKSAIRNMNIGNANVCTENYANPPIPKGYKHICGEWNSGFVIEIRSNGSQFVWIPVGCLGSNGTLDGVLFNEKFGRRNYRNDEFSESKFNETLTDELVLQMESVKKYGGFYISRYNISKNAEGKPLSVKDAMPWIDINFYGAKEIASTIVDNDEVSSHLVFGAEYDSVLEWFIASKARTHKEIAKNSTYWGNHLETKNHPDKLVKTGTSERWCTNRIYDFAGNVNEWTQEKMGSSSCVIRGGYYCFFGDLLPVSNRVSSNPHFKSIYTGFRASLYIR